MQPPPPHQILTLQDGRRLSYLDIGPTVAPAVVFFHGYPGSRLQALLLERGARRVGVRLVGFDRAGMGWSDPRGGVTLLEAADDVAELADHLELRRFAVLGWSGGGPFALACAVRMSERLTACGLMAGMAPPDLTLREGLARNRFIPVLAQRAPWLFGPMTWWMWGRLGRDAERYERALRRMLPAMPESDRAAYAQPGVMGTMAASICEAFRQGARGQTDEGLRLGRPWGYALSEVPPGRVLLWHGEADTNVPAALARGMVERLRDCQATFYREEGHLSLLINRQEDVLRALAETG